MRQLEQPLIFYSYTSTSRYADISFVPFLDTTPNSETELPGIRLNGSAGVRV